MIKVGNVSLNPEAFKDWKKEDFIEAYKGKLAIDINEVWEGICLFNKISEPKTEDHGSIGESSKKGKKFERRGTNGGSGEQ